MKRVAVTLLVFSIVFFGASILQAGKPDMYSFSGGGQGFVGYCADFEVWEDVTWKMTVKDYYNKDGEFIRQKIHMTLEGVVFNYDNCYQGDVCDMSPHLGVPHGCGALWRLVWS